MWDGCQNSTEAATDTGACNPPIAAALYTGGPSMPIRCSPPHPLGVLEVTPQPGASLLALSVIPVCALPVPPCPRPLTPFKSMEEQSPFR